MCTNVYMEMNKLNRIVCKINTYIKLKGVLDLYHNKEDAEKCFNIYPADYCISIREIIEVT